MAFSLKDRWAVVTGASTGIGKAIAEKLAARGCHLFLVARRERLLEDLASGLSSEYGIRAEWRALDLTSADTARILAERLEAFPVSIVVNNAGIAVAGSFDKAKPGDLSKMIDLNIRFVTEFCRVMLEPLKRRPEGARILNVGSITGYQGIPNMAAYAATKAYINNFSEGLNWELRGTGVVVTCLQPGQTSSEFFEVAGVADAHMANTGLLTPGEVARQGVAAMVKGRPRRVTGWVNRIRVFGLRFSPRGVVRLVITRMFRDMAGAPGPGNSP